MLKAPTPLLQLLEELQLTPDQFIDVCILCGCDYCGRIPGIGPTKALDLVRQQGAMEGVLAKLDRTKFVVPEPYPYEEARRLFKGAMCWSTRTTMTPIVRQSQR